MRLSVSRLGLTIGLCVAVGGLTITTISYLLLDRSRTAADQQRFERLVSKANDDIERRLRTYEAVLAGGVGLMQVSDTVTPGTWRRYVETLDLKRVAPGVLGIGTITAVPAAERDAYNARQQSLHGPAYVYRTVGQAPKPNTLSFVIDRIEPLARNAAALGLDVGSERNRLDAVRSALARKAPTITAPIQLVQDNRRTAGFLLLVPRPNSNPQDLVYAPLVGADLLAGLLPKNGAELGFAVYDQELADSRLIYATGPQISASAHSALIKQPSAGRTWVISHWSTPQFAHHSRGGALAVMLIGVALTALLTIGAVVTQRNHRAIAKTARDRKRDLELAASAAGLGQWSFATDHNRVESDENTRSYFGIEKSADSSQLETWLQRIHPDDRDTVVSALNHCTETGAPYHIAFRTLGSDDQVRHVLSAGTRSAAPGEEMRVAGICLDLSARIQQQQALEQQQHINQLFVQHAPAAIAIFDTELRYLAASERWSQDYSLEPARTLIGRNHYEVMPEVSTKQDLIAIHQACLKGESKSRNEDQLVRSDGSEIFITWEIHPWRKHSDEIGGVIMFTQDVTEQVHARQVLEQAQAELQIAQDRLELATRAGGIGIWDWFLTDNRLTWTPKMFELFGVDPNDSSGHIEDFTNAIHDDDLARVSAAVQSAIDDNTDFLQEYRTKAPGTPTVLAAGKVIRDETGTPQRMLGIALDVSEQARVRAALEQARDQHQLSAQRLDLALVSSDVGLWDWNVVTGEVWFSDTWLSMLGYQREDLEPVVDTWAQLVHPDDADLINNELTAHLERRSPTYRTEHRCRCKDGSWRWILDCGRVIDRDIDGSALRAIGTHVDITALKAFQTELETSRTEARQAQRAAEEAAEARSRFLATMSHEIRTPLNGVIGMTEVLTRTDLNTDQIEYVATINQCGEALLSIINDILDYSKIEADGIELENCVFDPHALVDEVITIVADRAHERNLSLCGVVRHTVPKRLRGDPARLRQILLNLLSNALKFTEQGEVILEVDCAEATTDAASLTIKVKDTGIGMDEEARSRVFTPFSQADASTTRRFGGTGLGLSITRRLVELMGGAITIDSEPNNGTTIIVSLLLESEPNAPDPETHARLQGRHILNVDDRVANRQLIGELAVAWGMQITQAEDAIQALRLLRSRTHHFDLVLTDQQMPDLDGLTLIKILNDDPGINAPPVMLLTSESSPKLTEEAEALGVAAVLPKPIRHHRLLDAIISLFGGVTADSDNPFADSQTDGPWFSRALVAEDNAINQRLIGLQLTEFVATTDFVGNGAEAIEAIQNNGYDLIFMDCQMPVMDGLDATSAIRLWELAEHRPRIPIIALTANALPGDRERCLAIGMDGYLAKPLRIEDLRAVLSPLKNRDMEAPTRSIKVTSINPAALDLLRQNTGEDGFRELIAVSVETFTALRAQAANLIEDPTQNAALADLAHSVKGSAAGLGLETLASCADQLCEAARHSDQPRINELWPRWDAQISSDIAALEAAGA
ncbi:MAG: PAS domain-containing protein [Planctomycetota bacterium]|jgi:PAS domain S-box-containing protein|nr:PAS domain-containing protein [Planctomycetota bacterium]